MLDTGFDLVDLTQTGAVLAIVSVTLGLKTASSSSAVANRSFSWRQRV